MGTDTLYRDMTTLAFPTNKTAVAIGAGDVLGVVALVITTLIVPDGRFSRVGVVLPRIVLAMSSSQPGDVVLSSVGKTDLRGPSSNPSSVCQRTPSSSSVPLLRPQSRGKPKSSASANAVSVHGGEAVTSRRLSGAWPVLSRAIST
jgi:hypothetical protein